mgnify:CR=1 FL=1
MNKNPYETDNLMKKDHKQGSGPMDKRPVFKIIMKPRKRCKLHSVDKKESK